MKRKARDVFCKMTRGFDFRLTDGQTDICNCRVAFAAENDTEDLWAEFRLLLD